MFNLNPETFSPDMNRILSIPVKPPVEWGGWPVFDSLYRCGDADDSPVQLNILQRVGLATFKQAGGLLAPLPVGWGKTLLGLLCATVAQAKRPVYLTRSKNVETVRDEIAKWKEHFYLPHNIPVFGYEGHLSRAEFATLLTRLDPDLLIVDEVHCLSQLTAARTKRFVRYAQQADGKCKFVMMSGTLTKRSIRDYEHLSRICLREGSPLPFDPGELQAWSGILDSGMDSFAGDFVPFLPLVQSDKLTELVKSFGGSNSTDLRTTCREAFRARLHSCPGVVATSKPSVDASLCLNLYERVQVDSAINAELLKLDAHPEDYGLLPPTDLQNPQAYDDYISTFKAEKENQLLHGFYYSLDWPNGQPDMDYINARSRWSSMLKRELEFNAREEYDSPALIEQAVNRGEVQDPDLQAALEIWKLERRKKLPPKVVNWVSDYLLEQIAKWVKKQSGSLLIWTAYDAFGERLSQFLKVPYYGAGSTKPTAKVAVASAEAHGTGANLQYYANQLITSPVLSGAAWEQLLGRTHRQGQLADEVEAHIFMHRERYKRKWREALEESKYLQESTGQQQKLLYATIIKHKEPFMK